jgi:hypothetical protein
MLKLKSAQPDGEGAFWIIFEKAPVAWLNLICFNKRVQKRVVPSKAINIMNNMATSYRHSSQSEQLWQ